MHASANGLQLPLDVDDRALTQRMMATLEAAGNHESYIRCIITRGPGTAPNIDLAYATGPCTTIVMVRELATQAADAVAHLAIVHRLRQDRRALDPAIKSGNYLNNVMGLQEAKAKGATDCLFLNQQGKLTEASTSNFCLVKDGQIFTPPLNAGLLAGITRRLLIQMCQEQDIPFHEKQLTQEDAQGADEIFLTSTLRNVLPATQLDGQTLGSGEPGPVTRKVMQQLEEYNSRRIQEVDSPAIQRLMQN